MSRWLVVGEGPTELGSADRPRFLQRLVETVCLGDQDGLSQTLHCDPWGPVGLPELRPIPAARLKDVRLPSPQPKGMARIAARALRSAQIQQCDAVVLLIDGDHKSNQRRGEVERGLADAVVPTASGIAKETVEAWLLADDGLFPFAVSPSGAPEDLWGAPNDGIGNHPKCVLKRALKRNRDETISDAVERWDLARAARRAPWLRNFCIMVIGLVRDEQ